MAAQELLELNQLLTNVTPNSQHSDARVPSLASKKLSTSYFYQLLMFWGVRWAFESWIWDPIIPIKHKVFLWLVFWGRLNTKDNMMKKGWTMAAPNAGCDLCPGME